jgi:hypothetical protein
MERHLTVSSWSGFSLLGFLGSHLDETGLQDCDLVVKLHFRLEVCHNHSYHSSHVGIYCFPVGCKDAKRQNKNTVGAHKAELDCTVLSSAR